MGQGSETGAPVGSLELSPAAREGGPARDAAGQQRAGGQGRGRQPEPRQRRAVWGAECWGPHPVLLWLGRGRGVGGAGGARHQGP